MAIDFYGVRIKNDGIVLLGGGRYFTAGIILWCIHSSRAVATAAAVVVAVEAQEKSIQLTTVNH